MSVRPCPKSSLRSRLPYVQLGSGPENGRGGRNILHWPLVPGQLARSKRSSSAALDQKVRRHTPDWGSLGMTSSKLRTMGRVCAAAGWPRPPQDRARPPGTRDSKLAASTEGRRGGRRLSACSRAAEKALNPSRQPGTRHRVSWHTSLTTSLHRLLRSRGATVTTLTATCSSGFSRLPRRAE